MNGDFLDNRPPNLRILCPNCHSQTDTYAGRNRSGGPPVDPAPPTVPPAPLTLREAEELIRQVDLGALGPSEAARQIGCHRNHIARLRARLAARGTLAPAPRPARRPVLEQTVISYARTNPELGPRKLAELIRTVRRGMCGQPRHRVEHSAAGGTADRRGTTL